MTNANGNDAPLGARTGQQQEEQKRNELTNVDAITNHASGVLENVAVATVQQIDSLIGRLQAMRLELLTDVARVRATIRGHLTLADQFGASVNIIGESIDKLRADNARLVDNAKHEEA